MNPKLKTQLFLISSCWASSAFSNTVSSTSDLHNQIKAVKENVRRERKNVDGLRRNIQTNLTASGNSTTVTSSVVSSNVTMSKNPFRNPEPFNGPWPECLGWDAQDCANYIKLLAPDVDNLPIVIPPDIARSGGSGTGARAVANKRDIHRVYIIVDEYGVVSMNPHRA